MATLSKDFVKTVCIIPVNYLWEVKEMPVQPNRRRGVELGGDHPDRLRKRTVNQIEYNFGMINTWGI